MLEKVEIINRFLSNIMMKGYSPSFFDVVCREASNADVLYGFVTQSFLPQRVTNP